MICFFRKASVQQQQQRLRYVNSGTSLLQRDINKNTHSKKRARPVCGINAATTEGRGVSTSGTGTVTCLMQTTHSISVRHQQQHLL